MASMRTTPLIPQSGIWCNVTDLFLAMGILETLDVAVLKRADTKCYEIFGNIPQFYSSLFPSDPTGPCVTPWEHSEMLAFFIEDAEDFFARCQSGSIASGIWQESGVADDNALHAMAAIWGDTQIILLRRLSDDYIDRARILQKARENLLERRRLTSDLELYKQKSRFDSLTSLYNRGTFMEILQLEIAAARNSGAPLSLLLMDIDDFKSINDTYGHLAGDAVLSSMGQLLRAHLRRDDVATRYGGEEFIVLVPGTAPEQAGSIAKKLRERIGAHSFGALPPISVSVGYTTFIPGESSESLLSRADSALYDAKRQGKNCERFR